MKIIKACILVFSILLFTTTSVTAFSKGHDGNRAGVVSNSSMPPGLQKQDKTPYGWSQGKKVGWHHHHHHHDYNDRRMH